MARQQPKTVILFADPLGGAPLPCVPRWPARNIGKRPVTMNFNLVFSTPAAWSPATNGGAPCAF